MPNSVKEGSDSMKRVILFIPSLVTGGAEKFVTDLAIRIDKDRFSVCVAVISDIIPSEYAESQFPELLKSQGIGVYCLKGRNRLHTIFNILKFLRLQRPDVVHTNLGSLYYVMVPAAIFGIKRRVHTFHNMPDFTAKGIKKHLYNVAFKLLNFTPVAVSQYVGKEMSDYFKIPFEEIQCIYNGVDTKAFYPAIRSYHSNVASFINLGSLTPVKNHKLLIDAFVIAREKCEDIRLTILGEGELREGLSAQIADYGLSDFVDISGVTKDVSYRLNCADIYIMSSNTEGLPLSILEAMASGLPVIATDAGGVTDIVSHGENGFICPVWDAEALSDAMVRLVHDPDLRKSMGEAARKRAITFDYEYCIKKYQKLYMGA